MQKLQSDCGTRYAGASLRGPARGTPSQSQRISPWHSPRLLTKSPDIPARDSPATLPKRHAAQLFVECELRTLYLDGSMDE